MTLKRYVYIHSIRLVFSALIMAGLSSAAIAAEKRGIPALPSPIDAAIPTWSDAVKERRKHDLKFELLPDLVAIVEITADPCTANVQIRNNSHHGLSREEWESEDDTVRLELRDILAGGVLVEDWNFRFEQVDPGRALMHGRGETLAFPWAVPGSGSWQLVLIVDVEGAIPELSDTNNRAEAILFCTE